MLVVLIFTFCMMCCCGSLALSNFDRVVILCVCIADVVELFCCSRMDSIAVK